MSEKDQIMRLIQRYQELSVHPRHIFLNIFRRTGLKYTEYSRAINKYPEYLNNRLNKGDAKPIGLKDIFELRLVVQHLFPTIKFSDLLEEALLNIEHKNLKGIALHKYYQEKIGKLEQELIELKNKE